MIKILNQSKSKPYQLIYDYYYKALRKKQTNIEAITISSFNKEIEEVDSRYVNLKFISNEEFIFFSNYNSTKASSFISHNQIAALFFWPSINIQIRMKAKIKKTTSKYNQEYFSDRSMEKNALSISSNQSKIIGSFNQVKENYKNALNNDDLKKCPDYWGGYSFTPYEIEFWKGGKFRLNERNLYIKDKNNWKHFILEP